MRVVTHTCSNTEIVAALGCGHLIVGVDDHSDYPEALVAGVGRIGKDLDVDPDRVAALRPDLVISSLTVPGHERVIERLLTLKVPLLVLAPKSVADVARDIRMVAGVLGVAERGEALARELEQALAVRTPVEADAPRVLVEWWPKPVIAACRQSWVNDLIAAAGGINPLADRDVASAPLTDDEVVAMNPDAVVISWCGVPSSHYRPEVVLRRPAWAGVNAVARRQVTPISEAFLGRPGPRLIEGLAALRAVVEAARAGAR